MYMSLSPAGPVTIVQFLPPTNGSSLMRFLISALLPLITLAVHVAATNPEQGSIPLNHLPRPGDAHLHGPPPSYEEAIQSNNNIPAAHLHNPALTSFDEHEVQPAAAMPNVSPRCLEAARQQAYAEAIQVVGNRDTSQLHVVITSGDAPMDPRTRRKAVVVWCAVIAGIAGIAVYAIWASAECHPTETAPHCTAWRRRDKIDSTPNINQCKPLDVDACRNPSPTGSLSKPSTLRGHGKRDFTRMSYHRRLELE
ncbi:hypothetical protein F5879DRAFT_1005878 [Lentinula edodes]|nr:hypothetical protein F5879DRAFT_1005878 [Lentinula edodes]